MLKRTRVLVGLGFAALAIAPDSTGASLGNDKTLVPIGGDYETVNEYVRIVVKGIRKGQRGVDFAIVPSPYAETKEEAIENGDYELALEHVNEILVACEAIVDHAKFPDGCNASLVDLFTREDASNPAIVAALSAKDLDGVFILGGDQTAAMAAMAGTPAEKAMAAAYERGTVFSGTSAGNSVLSYTMTNGYTDYGDASLGLQLGSVDMAFPSKADPLDRGLSFGSQRAFFDQHLYERGRTGRLFNETAQTADRYGNGGLLGIGVDTGSAPVVVNDRYIKEVFGPTSITIADFKTLRTSHTWVDTDGKPVKNPTPETTPTAALSARNILVHVLAPAATKGKSDIAYDMLTRVPSYNGKDLRAPYRAAFSCDDLRSRRPALIGGDLSVGPEWPTRSPVLEELIERGGKDGTILIATAAYGDQETADADVATYSESLVQSGFHGTVRSVAYPGTFSAADIAASSGVILLGGNQANLPDVLANPAYRSFVQTAADRAPIVFYEHAFAAAAGDVYDAIDDAADWIEAYNVDQAVVKKGLGLVTSGRDIAFEPRLQYDYRYGRMYGIPFAAGRASKRPTVFAISEGSALLVGPKGAKVLGANPVIQTDTSAATLYAGDNGTVGAINAVIDVYEPEQRISRFKRRHGDGFWFRRDRSDAPRPRQR